MRRLLVRFYPASWRARYGPEFEALLADRHLGPFDVADVLLGALDAHLHLRGLLAGGDDARGFPMTIRIGGYAAIAGGLLWFLSLAGGMLFHITDAIPWFLLFGGGTLALLVALVGLSAFHSRRDAALVWASVLIPAIGGVVSVVGLVGLFAIGDRPMIGDASPWWIWLFGSLTLILGSGLFALMTLRARSLSRLAAGLLGLGAVAVLPGLLGLMGSTIALEIRDALALVAAFAFCAGWIGLGVSAIRLERRPSPAYQAALP